MTEVQWIAKKVDGPICPICHEVVDEKQMDAHYELELRQLEAANLQDFPGVVE